MRRRQPATCPLRGAKLGPDEPGNLGADLSCADLTGADLRKANQRKTNLKKARLSGTRDLGLMNLSNPAKFIAMMGLGDTDLNEAIAESADLSEAYMAGAILRGANLSSARVEEADLTAADLRKTVLEFSDLEKADLSNTSRILLSTVNLTDALYDADTKWPDGFDPAEARAKTVGQMIDTILPPLLIQAESDSPKKSEVASRL